MAADDEGTAQRSVNGTVRITLSNVNDNPPTFINYESVVVVAEDVPLGNDVRVFDVKDNDGDTVTLTLVGGDVDDFSMSGTTLRIAKKLDYEQSSFHTLVIQ